MEFVEDILDCYTEPICRPLTSYINRVYEIVLEEPHPLLGGNAAVVKFYRPGRWTVDALLEEHDFMFDLREADVPVVAPYVDEEGNSLFQEAPGIWGALYPRKRGRPFEDLDDAGWQELGRTLARVHRAGDQQEPEHRIVWHPLESGYFHLDIILDHLQTQPDLQHRYEDVASELIETIAPLFDESVYTRIHGDMHPANLMRRPDQQGLFLIDFDDMAFGPPVQDLWMLLPDRADRCARELSHLLSGYRVIREFDQETLQWIEPLRAMRFLHFTAWCVQQQQDRSRREDQEFGSKQWWNRELGSLQDQRAQIRAILGM